MYPEQVMYVRSYICIYLDGDRWMGKGFSTCSFFKDFQYICITPSVKLSKKIISLKVIEFEICSASRIVIVNNRVVYCSIPYDPVVSPDPTCGVSG